MKKCTECNNEMHLLSRYRNLSDYHCKKCEKVYTYQNDNLRGHCHEWWAIENIIDAGKRNAHDSWCHPIHTDENVFFNIFNKYVKFR